MNRARAALLRALVVAAVVTCAVLPSSTPATAGGSGSGGASAYLPSTGDLVTSQLFGMHVPNLLTDFPPVPAGSVNLMTDGVYWPRLETAPGVFAFGRLDGLVAQAEAHAARPLLVLGQTPSFHVDTETPGTPGTGVNAVPDPAAWAAYVRAVVERYGARLDYQIWPEPNVPHNWSGTEQQMADLVAAASRIIREVAPDATIVAPGMVLRLRFERRFMRAFFATTVDGLPLGQYVDAVGVDPYPLTGGGPEDSLAEIQAGRRILAADGVDLPLWTVEVNYGAQIGSVGVADPLSAATQAAWVARTYLLSAAAGVERVYWLGWGRFDNLNIQMVDLDLVTPTAAARSFAVAAQWLVGQRPRGCTYTEAQDLYTCRFTRAGHPSWAFWTGSGVVKVPTPKTAVWLHRVSGATGSARQGGLVRVTSAPVWITS